MAGLGAFQGTYSDFRLVKGRKVAQIVVEVPIEAADHALEVLGGVPRPDAERHVAVARLQIPPGATGAAIGSAAADHPPPPERSAAPGGAYAKRAGILCNDPKFQAWMGTPDAEQTAERLRLQTGVHSRRDYDHDPDARRRFLNLETSYLSETGQLAERRR